MVSDVPDCSLPGLNSLKCHCVEWATSPPCSIENYTHGGRELLKTIVQAVQRTLVDRAHSVRTAHCFPKIEMAAQ